MPLLDSALSQSLEQAWSPAPSSFPAAMQEAKAICQMIDQGVTAAGGMAASAAFAPLFAQDIADIADAQMPAKAAAAKYAKALHKLMSMLVTTGGAHGVGSLMTDDPASLAKDLGDMWEQQLSTAEAASKKAKLIKTYVSGANFNGTGVPPTMVPDISPLS